jgi:hypothetical protein
VTKLTRRNAVSSSDLVRWGGLAAMAAGVLYIVMGLLPSPAFGDQPLSPGYYLFILVGVLASLLLLGGLVGLHILHAKVYGWLGTAGFLLVFISTLILAVLGPVEMTAGDSASVLHSLLGVTGLVGLVGLLLLGGATVHARVLPLPWAALPLAILLVRVLVWFLLPPLIFRLGLDPGTYTWILTEMPPVLVGLGWALLGYALWSGTSEGFRPRLATVR